jgi:hypothetical protein
MSATRTQRIIAVILLISPWIYIPTIFKEIIFILLAGLLYLSTIEIRKKHKDSFEAEAEPVTPIITNPVA